MLLDSEPAREIYLVFMDCPYRFNWLFKSGFQHVYAIERQAIGWLCSDPSRSDLHTYILPASYNADVISEFRKRHPDFTVMHLSVKAHTKDYFPNMGFISCTSIMQYIVGVWWPFVFTPYQLYNRLTRRPPTHIEVMKSWQDTNYTQHKEKQKPQHKRLIWLVSSLSKKLRWKSKRPKQIS